jgi:VWFA-related protein
VLIVVSDGGDNASTATFDEVVQRSDAANTTIYSIVIQDRLDREGRPDRLKQLAAASGGQTFEPSSAAKVEEALKQIARDIRNTYTVGYVPTDSTVDGRFRRIQVAARGSDGAQLRVRTREGYIAERR